MVDTKISNLTGYTTPLDADVLPVVDTANTTTKKTTWANIKATLKTYFDTLYPAETTTTAGALINGATAKTTPVDADFIGLMDSAASNILKKLSWANIKATLKTYFDTLYVSGSGTGVIQYSVSTTCTVSVNDLIADFDLTTALNSSTSAIIILGRAMLHSANFNTDVIIGRASSGNTPTGNTSIILSNGVAIAYSKLGGNTPTGIACAMTSATNLRVTLTYGSTPGAAGAAALNIIIIRDLA